MRSPIQQGSPILRSTSTKYLGIRLTTSPDYLSAYEREMRGKAARNKGVLCQRSLWSYSRYEVMRALWKMVAVKGLTYANAVLCLSSGVWEFLERRQREIGRLAPGVRRLTPVEAIQEEMGWSSFTAREAVAKATYENQLLRLPGENVARPVMVHTIFAEKSTKWMRRTAALRRHFGLPTICLEDAAQKPRDPMSRGTRLQVRQREAAAWRKAAEQKSSLELYRSEKLEIRTECCYDNSKGSALLAEAKAGVLRTRIWRERFTEGVSTTCALCGESDETLCHVVLECGGIFPTRTQALPTALGFKTEEGGAAEVTKKRLEFWWQHGALRR
ncbi:hypothetical protein HPB49_005559 [Dermacentor silvarum]|uniref:Uncharacterized protein n=1 Tax=Dermacentor silvarum TaxID=543639 RepID=A0ACB8CQ95_DERSI|nr:hypothetical protein HPB49_005559 [Dermacentor silvarum]